MITIEIVRTPDGGEAVLTPKSRIETAKRQYAAQSRELRRVADEMKRAIESTNPPADADEIEIAMNAKLAEANRLDAEILRSTEIEEKIREKCAGHIEAVEYNFRPYTDGEKQDALAEATDYSSGSPRLGTVRYHRALVMASTGLSAQDLRSFSPARAQALISEVIDRSEPDPLRLDFLS